MAKISKRTGDSVTSLTPNMGNANIASTNFSISSPIFRIATVWCSSRMTAYCCEANFLLLWLYASLPTDRLHFYFFVRFYIRLAYRLQNTPYKVATVKSYLLFAFMAHHRALLQATV